MITPKILSLIPLALWALARSGLAADIAIDLTQTETDEKVQVVQGEHYGLSSTEFTPKTGFVAVSVVDSSLPVWKTTGSEHCSVAILYYGRQPLSLLYLEVVSGAGISMRYFVKIGTTWREVIENVMHALLWLDRDAHDEPYLREIAEDYIRNGNADYIEFRPFLPQTYNFITDPYYECELDILNPNPTLIMTQRRVGPTFGKVFTPRLDIGVSRVTYGRQELWAETDPHELCCSVFTHLKGDFPKLVVVNLNNVTTGHNRALAFVEAGGALEPIEKDDMLKRLTAMTVAEYTRADIECYKTGFLRLKDSARALGVLFALASAAAVACYHL